VYRRVFKLYRYKCFQIELDCVITCNTYKFYNLILHLFILQDLADLYQSIYFTFSSFLVDLNFEHHGGYDRKAIFYLRNVLKNTCQSGPGGPLFSI
jgi:hypothetical protein